jgi:hypothetical protein
VYGLEPGEAGVAYSVARAYVSEMLGGRSITDWSDRVDTTQRDVLDMLGAAEILAMDREGARES